MNSGHSDSITVSMILNKVPGIIAGIPKIIKGLRSSNISNPRQSCGLGWTFELAAKKNPRGSAVLYENTRFTYDEFNRWANRYAHYLMSQGVKKGDVVGIFIENRPELLAAVLGATKVGAVCAMLNTSQTGKVLVHSFNLVKPNITIVGEELVSAFNEIRDELDSEADSIYYLADQDTTRDPGQTPDSYINLASASADSPQHNPGTTSQVYVDDPCFYIYTSGTTGLPKAGIFKQNRWMKAYGGFGLMAMQLGHQDVLYSTLPLYHGTGLCVGWSTAIAGASGFAIRRKFSASSFWADTRKFNATAIVYVGELCRYLMDQPERPDDAANPVLKMVGNGLRPNIWGPFKKRFSIEQVLELYAASDGNIGFANFLNFDNTVGLSPGKWELVKYDKEKEEPIRDAKGFMIKAGTNGTGLLLAEISDKTPLDGYTDADKTQKVILHDVFKKGDKWFNTGDMLRNIGFGHCQFVDRLGDTFRWKGENVSTTEVENLISAHAIIGEAVVYGVEIPNTNGRAGMAAITLTEPLDKVCFKSLHEYLSKNLPAYAIPLFLRIKNSMDTTGTFKYKKSDLKEEAYDLSLTNEPIYALLPKTNEYIPIDQEIISDINRGKYRF